MLRPIPSALLKDSAVIKVPTGMDRYQNITYTSTTVSNVHMQNTNEVRKTSTNNEVVLRSILFIDGTRSSPQLDYDTLMQTAEAKGIQLRVVVFNSAGNQLGDYAVMTCDPVPDIPSNRVHHVELGLI